MIKGTVRSVLSSEGRAFIALTGLLWNCLRGFPHSQGRVQWADYGKESDELAVVAKIKITFGKC